MSEHDEGVLVGPQGVVRHLILRVEELTDDGLDGPCDLVALDAAEDDDEGEHAIEMGRKHFKTGHLASKHLAKMVASCG